MHVHSYARTCAHIHCVMQALIRLIIWPPTTHACALTCTYMRTCAPCDADSALSDVADSNSGIFCQQIIEKPPWEKVILPIQRRCTCNMGCDRRWTGRLWKPYHDSKPVLPYGPIGEPTGTCSSGAERLTQMPHPVLLSD